MANSKGKGDDLLDAVEYNAGEQTFILCFPPECRDCIFRGVAAKPDLEMQPRGRRRRTTGPMNKAQLSKRQLKKLQQAG